MPLRKKPTKPKRPLNSYMLWFNHKRIQLKRENPDLKMTEICKLAAEIWRELDDKSQWVEQAELLRRDYYKKLEKQKKAKKFLPPKRPLGSYMLWFKQNRLRLQSENPQMTARELARLAGEEWRQCTDKQQWKMMAEILKRKYLKDKSDYEDLEDQRMLKRAQYRNRKKRAGPRNGTSEEEYK